MTNYQGDSERPDGIGCPFSSNQTSTLTSVTSFLEHWPVWFCGKSDTSLW